MRLFLSTLFLIGTLLAQAQPEAYFDYKVFGATPSSRYAEIYLNFSALSLGYSPLPDNSIRARLLTTIIIEKDSVVVDYIKTEVNGPACKDSLLQDFIFQNRFKLSPGSYTVSIDLTDLNKTQNNTVHFSQEITITPPAVTCFVSEILLVDEIAPASNPPSNFTRGNQDLIPLVTNFLSQEYNHLRFYAEIYNSKQSFTDSSAAFLCLYKIANPKTGAPFRNFQKVMRMKANEVIPLLADLDISMLPSGNYDIVIEIRSKTNELIAKANRSFQRSNIDVEIPAEEIEQLMLDNSFVGYVSSVDTLTEYIYCLRPIGTEKEKYQIDHQKDLLPTLDMKKRFFYSFWANRNALDPSQGWADYKREVAIAEGMFKTRIKKGYETDRGRVYLQYGPPNVRTERPTEPSAYPYEIWHYYKIKQYSNKRFVFFNQDLISNDYELIHSDMYGEIRNANWQNFLSRRNSPVANPDRRTSDPQFGGRADDFFVNPR